MSDDATARLGLPYLAAGQMQKHVTLNEALTRLDALVQPGLQSRTTSVQPGDPDDGDLYILPDGATGAVWSAWDAGDLVRAEGGAWSRIEAPDGIVALVLDAGQAVVRRDGDWVLLGGCLGQVQGLTRLGLDTTADAANPFAARLNKALWTAREAAAGGDGDLRLTLNKETSGDVLSLLFQSGFGGRAELGLIGDDDLRLKVSADGSTWRDVMAVDGASGRVLFVHGAGRRETTVFTVAGEYVVPPWARSVEATCVGGGGGGGAGAFGAGGTSRYGGGGGGAGGVSRACWEASGLPSALDITVGGGGAGGAAVAGTDGGDSAVLAAGVNLLAAIGGQGGQAGDAASGAGGQGGAGLHAGNRGGASSLSATAEDGEALARPDGGGGGGGGGGLDASDIARGGGPGGAGACLAIAASAGTGGAAAAGGAGAAAPEPALHWAGGGGGGGGASTLAAGFGGGQGGAGGSGGGGGGAGLTAGGDGGAGAAGVVWVVAIG